METIRLNSNAEVRIFPDAIVVFNFSDGDDADGKLAQIVSANPVMPVVFINTEFSASVFSQAETRNRAFIFDRTKINPAGVSPELPAQWVSEGDFLPGLPGNISVEAADGGFRVTSLPPSPPCSAFFTDRA